ncbi:hypothetical protein Taro_006933 [Colocasia esculenta]|uniref:BHLH domain-containing protein n=1 Tax=Colocasia esculenta TaxID=4460 RepID=A0A843TXI3_COLES|nr:hypothetical protein [Colocasia esculenta]
MDPSSMVTKGTFADMWPFPQAAADPGAVLWGHAQVAPLVRGSGSGDAAVAASVEESTVTDQSGGIRSRRRRGDFGASGAAGSEDGSSRIVSTCSGNELTESEGKHLKVGGSSDENEESRPEVEASSRINKHTDQVSAPSEAPKQDYIHVRARRGQATDNHSLAERARREKISERMKFLQDLVPSCNKQVIGKALVLDEIINYIQSLQRQVEFLSMKLEALSSQVNPSIEGFPAKDVRLTELDIQVFDTTSGFAFPSQTTKDYGHGSPQEWLHMQVGGGI